MIKKICFLCVNYNSYTELNNYLKSINDAYSFAKSRNFIIDIAIADNSTIHQDYPNTNRYDNIHITTYSFNENLGYLGAITRMIQEIGYEQVKSYDFVIISNVDLLLAKSFFEELLKKPFNKSLGWIAPKILSISENKNRNPKMINRPTLTKMKLLSLMFRFSFLFEIYTKYIYKYKSTNINAQYGQKIYAGHGSIMIFSKFFFDKNVAFNFPSFLFGEEIFFGELVRNSGLEVIYYPDIVVHDIDHISTSKLSRSKYYKMNYQSLEKLTPLFK